MEWGPLATEALPSHPWDVDGTALPFSPGQLPSAHITAIKNMT